MQTHTCFLYENNWQNLNNASLPGNNYQLVLVFANRFLLEGATHITTLKQAFPAATVVSCSTSGEINGRQVYDNSLVATAIHFDKTQLRFACANSADFSNSHDLGENVAGQLPREGLKYVLVISNGGKVNGSELVSAINEELGPDVIVTGGLAGDGARFEKTLVGKDENINDGMVVLTGFYGGHLKVGYGLNGGWEVFGPERVITKSEQNVLYEIDHQNALELYKKYLGKYASELPGSALLFPLAIKTGSDQTTVVRTILTIDEEKQTMTFAGNVPEGAAVRLMKANFDQLIYSAGEAASSANGVMSGIPPQLVLLISCVGRKLVLGKRIDEEVDAAADIFPSNPAITGFYSYGEISPLKKTGSCELHNQTMTITTISEI
ncbi:MAG TPA: FIST N-terminal domain-containing protein [Chitinophagaceae bacterium]|nr:FIST N-terminal domain-containing protein [Chitinophagaceae bacterium]